MQIKPISLAVVTQQPAVQHIGLVHSTHVMVDIETMGTNPDAPILSIGWVQFTVEGVDHASAKCCRLDLAKELKAGAKCDADTIQFWMKQPDDARAELFGADVPAMFRNPQNGLSVFSASMPIVSNLAGVWGNGATFDNVLLRQCFARYDMVAPWPFYKDRCFRTLKNMLPRIAAPLFTGIKHSAMDDAVHQAEHAVLLLRELDRASPE